MSDFGVRMVGQSRLTSCVAQGSPLYGISPTSQDLNTVTTND